MRDNELKALWQILLAFYIRFPFQNRRICQLFYKLFSFCQELFMVSYKIIHGNFLLQYGRLDVLQVKAESVRALSRYFGMKFLSLEIRYNRKISMFGRYL